MCQELVHTLRYTKARKGGMILKIDLKKAYDRMEWVFVEETLKDAVLPLIMIEVILMKMLRKSHSRLLWNGELVEKITHSHGLRQGDPLSPYLFVLCLERLGHWIQQKVAERSWKPIKDIRGGRRISHLFFANYLLLFAEATPDQADCIKNGLHEFCKASGQRVNYGKSLLYVSLNVDGQIAANLSTRLGIPLTGDWGDIWDINSCTREEVAAGMGGFLIKSEGSLRLGSLAVYQGREG